MLLNAELCIVFSLCEHETTVCASCLCLHACMDLHDMQPLVVKWADIFVLCLCVCVLGRNTARVCMYECWTLSHCLPKESGFANAETALQDGAIAVCLLLAGEILWKTSRLMTDYSHEMGEDALGFSFSDFFAHFHKISRCTLDKYSTAFALENETVKSYNLNRKIRWKRGIVFFINSLWTYNISIKYQNTKIFHSCSLASC